MIRFNKTFLCLLCCLAILGCHNEVKSGSSPAKLQTSSNPTPKINFDQAAKYNVQLGISYLQKGSVARAKDKLNRAKKLAPNISEVHYAFGYFYEEIGEIAKAEHEYHQAIRLHKGGPEYNNLGAFLCRQHRFEEAISAFNKAVSDPQYSETAVALENAGLCMLEQKKIKEAKQYFTKALQHDGRKATVLLELADLMITTNDFVKANQYLTKFDKLTKPTPRSLYLNIKVAKYFNDQDSLVSNELLLQNKFTRSYENHLYQQEKQAKR